MSLRAGLDRVLGMRLALAAATIALILCYIVSGQAPLTLVGTIDLPGVEGRIDHLAVAGASQRLYIAALGNNTVEVLDLKTNRHRLSLENHQAILAESCSVRGKPPTAVSCPNVVRP